MNQYVSVSLINILWTSIAQVQTSFLGKKHFRIKYPHETVLLLNSRYIMCDLHLSKLLSNRWQLGLFTMEQHLLSTSIKVRI